MKVRVHWIEERHFTAIVEVDEVTPERAEVFLTSGSPHERDRMEIAEAQEYMLGMDAQFEARMLGVPVEMTLVDDGVTSVEEVEE